MQYLEKEVSEAALAEGKKEVLGEKIFGDFLFAVIAEYKSNVKNLADKQRFYQDLPTKYDSFLAKKQKAGFAFKPLPVKFEGWNNAALMAYSNYYSDVSLFEHMLKKCNKNVGRFVRWISQEREKSTGRLDSAPEEYLENVKESSCVD